MTSLRDLLRMVTGMSITKNVKAVQETIGSNCLKSRLLEMGPRMNIGRLMSTL